MEKSWQLPGTDRMLFLVVLVHRVNKNLLFVLLCAEYSNLARKRTQLRCTVYATICYNFQHVKLHRIQCYNLTVERFARVGLKHDGTDGTAHKCSVGGHAK